MSKKKLIWNNGNCLFNRSCVVTDAGETEEMATLPAMQQRLIVKLDAKQRGGKLVTLIRRIFRTVADLEKLGKQLEVFLRNGWLSKKQ